MEIFVWLAILITFLIVEIIKLKITYITISVASFAAMIINFIGISFLYQVLTFAAVFAILFFTVRPFFYSQIQNQIHKQKLEKVTKQTKKRLNKHK